MSSGRHYTYDDRLSGVAVPPVTEVAIYVNEDPFGRHFTRCCGRTSKKSNGTVLPSGDRAGAFGQSRFRSACVAPRSTIRPPVARARHGLRPYSGAAESRHLDKSKPNCGSHRLHRSASWHPDRSSQRRCRRGCGLWRRPFRIPRRPPLLSRQAACVSRRTPNRLAVDSATDRCENKDQILKPLSQIARVSRPVHRRSPRTSARSAVSRHRWPAASGLSTITPLPRDSAVPRHDSSRRDPKNLRSCQNCPGPASRHLHLSDPASQFGPSRIRSHHAFAPLCSSACRDAVLHSLHA